MQIGKLHTHSLAVGFLLGVSTLYCHLSLNPLTSTRNMQDTINTVDNESFFLQSAQSFDPITDKVTTHTYQIMYGQFLLPYYEKKPGMKMLEIGLGCDMNYGPGASVALWKKLFPQAELWEAEFNAGCVEKAQKEGQLDGINVLVGDQGNAATLDEWITKSGGANFDVVIDDGGHQQCQIWTTFQKLWPKLLPGGIYFIEDLQVSHLPNYNRIETPLCPKGTNVVDQVKQMLDKVAHDHGHVGEVKFVYCQEEACVIGKKP